MNAIEAAVSRAHRSEKAARTFITVCGIGMALVPFLIGAFLFIKGTDTFFLFGHGVGEFLFSGEWNPSDTAEGGGQQALRGADDHRRAQLLRGGQNALPSPRTRRLIQPAIELFTGIPSVVYGFVGMTVLIPFLRSIFPMPFGFSVLAAGIVLAIMIFPTITTMAADAMAAVPKAWREASYGLGATRWETIAHVVLPAAKGGIFTGIILGLARALGEALAVAMVIGQMKVFPTSLFLPASTLTTAISADMGGAMEGGEYSAALWTMALILFLLSFLFIFLIHQLNAASSLKGGK